MAEIFFTPDSIADLRQIKTYITDELCNPQAAEKTVSKILKDIRKLSGFPEMGSLLSSVINLETDYRYLICGKYAAFYRFTDSNIYIVRILYGRRDFMRILFGTSKE